MNRAATEASALGQLLRDDLWFADGLNEVFSDKPAIRWIREGGEHEDDGPLLSSRSLQHFDDPLRPWNDAGLQLMWPPFSHWESSIVWMQDDDGTDAGADGAAQGWSWPDARRSYYNALTLTAKNDRDQKWADTFRAVGQVMHLIEDAASPAHVRNDPHALEYICRTYFLGISCGGNFEYWTEAHQGELSFDPAAAEPQFDRAILAQSTGYEEAPAPVARLIDNQVYDGTNPPNDDASVAVMGIAEFTNANFFSEDTVSNYWYPFPSLNPSALVPVTVSAPRGILPRQYYAKADGYGYPVNPLVAEGVFDEVVNNTIGWLAPTLRRGGVDENVWQAYASILVPKAVDYAPGALDYFFRGRIDFVPDPDDPNGYLIKNLGPDDLNGTFELYYDDADGNRQLVPGSNQWQLPIPAAAHCQNGAVCNQGSVQAFNVAFDPPRSGTYTLVFHGTMGNEAPSNGSLGAVAAKVVGSSFLLYTESGAYQSAFLDHGWQRIASNVYYAWPGFSHADYVNSNLLFISTFAATKSTDGGRTFTTVEAPWGAFSYLGGKKLVAVGPGLSLASSDDLGVTWSITPGLTGYPFDYLYPDAVAYIGGGTLYAGSYGGMASYNYWSTQSGSTWSPFAPIPLSIDGSPLVTCSAQMIEGTPLCICSTGGLGCFDSRYDTFWVEGITWNRREGGNQVALANVWHEVTIPGTFGRGDSGIFRSLDGRDWHRVLDNGFGLPAIAPDGTALAIGYVEWPEPPYSRNALYRSFDAGETWQPAAGPPDGAWEEPSTGGSLIWMGNSLPPP